MKNKIEYNEYIQKVKDIGIAMTKDNNTAFVWPDYKYFITKEGLTPDTCAQELTWDDILEILKLEVEMWNRTQSNFGMFLTSLAEVFSDQFVNYIEHEKQHTIENELAKSRAEKDINS